jgi:hypothetical protein
VSSYGVIIARTEVHAARHLPLPLHWRFYGLREITGIRNRVLVWRFNNWRFLFIFPNHFYSSFPLVSTLPNLTLGTKPNIGRSWAEYAPRKTARATQCKIGRRFASLRPSLLVCPPKETGSTGEHSPYFIFMKLTTRATSAAMP